MATRQANPRLQVGSALWIEEERSCALQIAAAEAEEFTFSARNEVEWLDEHMAEIFSKNQVNVAEIFKTPGKLRGKTPRTAGKVNSMEVRAPLSDVFSATPRGRPSPFPQAHFDRPVATFQVAEDEPGSFVPHAVAHIPKAEKPLPQKPATNLFDSGYHGSQLHDAAQPNEPTEVQPTPKAPTPPPKDDIVEQVAEEDGMDMSGESEERGTTEGSFQSAKEELIQNLTTEVAPEPESSTPNLELEKASRPMLQSPLQDRVLQPVPPQKFSRQQPTAVEQCLPEAAQLTVEPAPPIADEPMDDVPSLSDGSSPIRPIVRKSSLNFASLPAREPIQTKKSIGSRVSRTSQLDQTRGSYYGRQTGGKSLGNAKQEEYRNEDDDEMDIDGLESHRADREDIAGDSKMSRLHSKTSTQRLQDQISMLGKSQSNVRPPSKSIVNSGAVTAHASQASHAPIAQQVHHPKSPQRMDRPLVAPGAFPEDEDDSWIGPPTTTATGATIFSPRPQLTKSYSAEVMEGIHGTDSFGGAQFNILKRGDEQRQRSPIREPAVPERRPNTLGHIKSVSTSVLRSPKKAGDSPGHKKAISVSNPNPSTGKDEAMSTTPPKSPSRSYRGSPLKAAKDKFSSILKTSRGLFASSAAVSAEAKKSTLSPPSTRIGVQSKASFEEGLESQSGTLYPLLDTENRSQLDTQCRPISPGKSSLRKTRASAEREERRKEEEAREAREVKEAQRMAEQLEKARAKVKEEARVYHLEQERVAAMQKQVIARKEQEKLAKESQVNVARATRSSPRKAKAQLEAEGISAAAATTDKLTKDIEMSDASAMPPPAIPRSKSQMGRPGAKRPIKPAKEPITKAKPPTVIRVDTGSQRGHQYHPSNSTLAATLQESLPAPSQLSVSQGTLRHKASTSSIQSKASASSFKSAATKALEAAARKKEQDELVAQRKREAKQEVERQRAALKEEERRKEELQRRQELTRQRELQLQREQAASLADSEKTASRQALEKRRLEMEKAKQTGAPPPAVRHQPSGDLSHATMQDKALPPVPQRGDLGQGKVPRMNPTLQRPQDDVGRSVNTVLHNTTKAPPKRPIQQDAADDHHSRPAIQRNATSYQNNDTHTKRRKTSEVFDDDDDMTEPHAKMTAPPIRQSSSRQKEVPTKSLFPSGYGNAPQPASLQRTTVISQHNINQSKPAHPMDMAQVSKAPIPFASSSSQGNSQPHKTPARPVAAPNGGKSTAKSAAKSSPRYQNGENIDLPEINTDSEDNDSDAGNDFVASAWTNSPDLRKQLAKQETIDPAEVFGQPGPLIMEEVFSKSKDRFHKFRARTSSANWTGQDRLTEDDIRRDLEARDRVRRQGGWTYDSMV